LHERGRLCKLKIKKEVVKGWKKRAIKAEARDTQEQRRVWEFDTFIRERLRSVGIIE
jgi:hypothetical protein